jgi:hypothetical protein
MTDTNNQETFAEVFKKKLLSKVSTTIDLSDEKQQAKDCAINIYASIYHQFNKPEKLKKIVDDLKNSIVQMHHEVIASGQVEEGVKNILEDEALKALTPVSPEVTQVQ